MYTYYVYLLVLNILMKFDLTFNKVSMPDKILMYTYYKPILILLSTTPKYNKHLHYHCNTHSCNT